MFEITVKYRLMRNTAKIFKNKKAPGGTAEKLREKYRKKPRIIQFPDKAWSPELGYERRLEHGCLFTLLTHRDSFHALMYIPGGGMLRFPTASDYRLFEELALKTGRDVIIPYYPPCINSTIGDSVDMVYNVYKLLVREYMGNVAVAGCSCGGTLALDLISHINVMGEHVPMPEKLYVSSPEMCIYSPEERELAKQLEKTDIVLDVDRLDMFYDIITNGRELPDYMTYPQLGTYDGLKEAYLCFAECETLCAMSNSLASRMEDSGVDVTLEKGIGMYHGYSMESRFRETLPAHYNMIYYLKAPKSFSSI